MYYSSSTLLILFLGIGIVGGLGKGSPRLIFTKEPPSRIEFVNTKGSKIDCAASGTPLPAINWTLVDGTSVDNILGLREVTPSGSLIFQSFRPERFRPDVHSAVYRCVAFNNAGVIHSRDVVVRGVVLQNLDIQVYDTYAIEGNTAVFKCHIPTVLEDYLTVTAWIKNDNLLIQPAIDIAANDKYALMPSGELHIHDLVTEESGSRYKCKAIHRLTGDTFISSTAGQLFVTKSRGSVSPRFVESASKVSIIDGQTAVLPCASQGDPVPTLSWHKKVANGQLSPLNVDGRIIVSKSALVIKETQVSDGGIYVCEIINDIGKERLEIALTVTEPLSAVILPLIQEVNVDNRASFKCEVTGQPISSVTWLHNGAKIEDATGSVLAIDSVQLSHQGIYQCIVKNNYEMVQATAELKMSEVPPQFIETFQEVIVQPHSQVNLKCVATGIPDPYIVWDIDGIQLNASLRVSIISGIDKDGKAVSNLMITKALVEDGGLYSCIASNKGGKIQHSARVNVYGALGVRQIPEVLLVSGGSAVLNCPIYGFPIPTVSWMKDGQSMPIDINQRLLKNGSLFMENIDKKINSGVYKCNAETLQGTIDVKVMVPPKIIPFDFLDDQFYKGMRAHVTCAISQGDLPVTFEWRKDGVAISPLLGIIVRKYDEHTESLSIDNVGSNHSGSYSCVARNAAGTAVHTAQLMVRVAPKIVPFSFQGDHVFEGALARLTCVVYQGDLPLTITWQKDGAPIPSALDVSIRKVDIYTSILTIDHVATKHGGNYTCIAQNEAASASHTASLVVNVPPHWTLQPTDKSVLKGSSVVLHCQASGFPKPEVSWLYVKDIKLGDMPKELQNANNLQIFSNGSLAIKRITSENEGYFFCKASNGIGIGLYARVHIKIHAPPHFKPLLRMQNATLGSEIILQCLIQGDNPIKVSWYKNENLIAESNPRYEVVTTTSGTEVTSVLHIKTVERSDNGNFQCVAENSFGKNKTEITVAVAEKPDPPHDFKASSTGSRYVELIWKMGYTGNDAIKKYIIQYKEAQNSWDEAVTMETVNGEPTNSVITHLHPSTHYVFRVSAENMLGRSNPSQILRITTKEDVPTGSPENVQVESVNTETFKVMWKAPDEKTWNGKIQGFYVGYKEVDTEDPYLYKTLLTPDPKLEGLAVQIGGLKQFTKYAVVVQAYNGQGKGPESEPVVVMTSEGVPSLPPTDVRCTTLTSQSIHITWTAPPTDSINGILRGYKVVFKPASDWFEDLAESYNITLPTSLTLIKLEKFTNYSIEVLAMTKAGDGPRSNIIFCKTLDDVPGPPVDIKAIATSEDSVIIAWKPPDHPNGVTRSYSIYWKAAENTKDPAMHTVPAHEQSYEVTGLKKGKRYEFWVTASTMAGEGTRSRTVMQNPRGPTVPAKVVSFEDKIITPWKSDIDLQCHSVGIPEPQRKWMLKGRTLESSAKTKILSDGTLSIRDVQEDDAGDYICHVQNDYGDDKITYTIIVLAPPAAPLVEIKTVSSNTIEVQWKTPASKMSRIKGYTLHVRRDVGEWKEINLSPDVRSYRLSSLDCGTRYEIYMSAFNKIGIGATSEILLVSTNGSVPTPPSKQDLIEETSTSVSLYLNTWKSNGCPILYYVVEYAPKSTNEWTFVSNNVRPEQRRLVIPNLRPGTWYGLRMTAHNSAGSSVAKYDFATFTVTGATIPPDLMSDSTNEQLDGLWAYLNFYIIVPICCTVVILLAILGVACYYVKSKNGSVRGHKGHRMSSTLAGSELKRGDSSESFSYMQRSTMSKSSGSSKHLPSDITPYATLQLTNQRPSQSTAGRCPTQAPPLPPPRMEGFSSSGHHIPSHHFFPGDQNNPMSHHGTSETTFIFPNISNDGRVHHFPAQYPHEAMRACFK